MTGRLWPWGLRRDAAHLLLVGRHCPFGSGFTTFRRAWTTSGKAGGQSAESRRKCRANVNARTLLVVSQAMRRHTLRRSRCRAASDLRRFEARPCWPAGHPDFTEPGLWPSLVSSGGLTLRRFRSPGYQPKASLWKALVPCKARSPLETPPFKLRWRIIAISLAGGCGTRIGSRWAKLTQSRSKYRGYRIHDASELFPGGSAAVATTLGVGVLASQPLVGSVGIVGCGLQPQGAGGSGYGVGAAGQP